MRLVSRVACALALGAALAAPTANAQIPGAHYSGTTDQNYPINFDVSTDGYLTNVVTTVNGSCGLSYSTNSPFAFPITAGEISGDDPDNVPYLRMRGSFSTPEQASGTLSAFNGTGGSPLFCNALNRAWSATTTASVPGDNNPGGGDPGGNPGGGDPGGGDPGTGGNPGGVAGTPALTISFPNGVLLKPSLANGFVVGITLDQPAALSGKVILSAKDAKKYGLGKKALTIAKASAPLGGTESSLEFKVKKAIAKKLKKAKKLKLALEVKATSAEGVVGGGKQTLSFK